MRSKPVPGRRLGWSDDDLRTLSYARFWNPNLAPLPAHVFAALHRGAVAEPLLPAVEMAPAALFGGGDVLEDGFALNGDGGITVAVHTNMPGVSPAMWDWWFAWHGDTAAKYKLWHPQAHVHAQWANPQPKAGTHRARYVGNTSIVDEYLGSEMGRFAIRFVQPSQLGFVHASLTSGDTIICARTGLWDLPIDAGYLAHHIRATAEGCEMRSRFWIGGRYAELRGGGAIGVAAMRVVRMFLKPGEADARNLLIHCAQEMQHLAAFLPALYAQEHATDG